MPKTILIVDDSSSLRQAVGMLLRNAGYATQEACDGLDALNQLDGQRFSLIISDVNMPNMDGLTFVRAARALHDYRFTPIIMLTTESDPQIREKGREAGVRAWLIKPFQPPKLLDAVAKLVLPE